VSEFRRNLDFVQEFLMPGVIIGFRYFQSDLYLLDRVLCPIHIRQRT